MGNYIVQFTAYEYELYIILEFHQHSALGVRSRSGYSTRPGT